jgi:hypothetical protein
MKTDAHRRFGPTAGLTMLEALVAVAILGVVVVGFTSFQSSAARTMTHYEIQGLKEDLKNRFRLLLDTPACNRSFDLTAAQIAARCVNTATFPAIGTAPGKFVTLKTGTGSVIAPGKIGDFQVRARCAALPTHFAIDVEALRVNAAGVATLDPLTGRTAAWERLFESAPLTCALPWVHVGFKQTLHLPNLTYYGKDYDGTRFLMEPDPGKKGAALPAGTPDSARRLCATLGMRPRPAPRKPATGPGIVYGNWTSPPDNANVYWNAATEAWIATVPDGSKRAPGALSDHIEQLWCQPP